LISIFGKMALDLCEAVGEADSIQPPRFGERSQMEGGREVPLYVQAPNPPEERINVNGIVHQTRLLLAPALGTKMASYRFPKRLTRPSLIPLAHHLPDSLRHKTRIPSNIVPVIRMIWIAGEDVPDLASDHL
jgi:hypothetical protein